MPNVRSHVFTFIETRGLPCAFLFGPRLSFAWSSGDLRASGRLTGLSVSVFIVILLSDETRLLLGSSLGLSQFLRSS